MVLHIEVNYRIGNPEKYSWIVNLLAERLLPLGITAHTYISPSQLNYGLLRDATNDSELQILLREAKQNSSIRKAAVQQNQSHILLTIASLHIDKILGKMYDHDKPLSTRNGCAVFESEIMKIAGQYPVSLQTLMGRTILHEIGHCLNLVHERDLFMMTQTNLLIESPLQPKWPNNIRFEFNQNDIDFVTSYPKFAKPGGRLTEYSTSDEYDHRRISNELEIRLDSFTEDLNFLKGDIIALSVVISNSTSKTAKLPMPLGQYSRNLCIELYGPDGESLELDLKKGCGFDSQYSLLKPGSKKYVSLNLHCNAKGYIFKTAGVYKIRCTIKKFKTKNTWYASELTDLTVNEPKLKDQTLPNKVYSKNLRQFLTGGAFNKTQLIRESNRHFRDEAFVDSNLLMPVCWIMSSVWKKEIELSESKSHIQKAKLRLKNIYETILSNESSAVKRGKIAKEYILLTESFSNTPKKTMQVEPKDIEKYEDFKIQLLGRTNQNENRKKYEEKLSFN
ncbi:hypothetical protein [Flavobacterium sp. YO64]|uniref:hypothetical protein n=1 Tax=Flavobacterium sp. YO64 TaxID=394559 RepID=UPI00100B97F4|nr:hypothetical protein [Flavobacterium sp. YO64]RXM44167.1 hypothetical protein BOW57_09765 [Flavobacterium sp. YO64]